MENTPTPPANVALAEYIDANGLKLKWFADRVKISQCQLWRWMRGETRPGEASRLLIEEVTSGAVKADAWPETTPKPKPNGGRKIGTDQK